MLNDPQSIPCRNRSAVKGEQFWITTGCFGVTITLASGKATGADSGRRRVFGSLLSAQPEMEFAVKQLAYGPEIAVGTIAASR
jgi:hypothetical protein